jgi:hypothetical protein
MYTFRALPLTKDAGALCKSALMFTFRALLIPQETHS